MGYSTTDRDAAAPAGLPTLVPSLSLPVTLVRTTLSAGVGLAGRTLRACATVDPAAVVTALAALPALAEGVAQLVQRLAVVAERVEGILDGVEHTQGRIDGLVDDLSELPQRIDTITASADTAIARVSDVTGTAAGAIDKIDSITGTAGGAIGRIDEITGTAAGAIDKIDAITTTAAGAIEKVDTTTDVAVTALGKVDGLVESGNDLIGNTRGVVDNADEAIGQVSGVLDAGQRTIDQANQTILAADPSVRQLAEITETVTRLRPLLANLEDVDPELARELVSMLRSLPGLMQRVDERVVPAVSSLEGLVPVVRTLHENVDQLQHVVNDVGTLLSGLPGAGRLLKRGGREVRSPENKTAITPPQ